MRKLFFCALLIASSAVWFPALSAAYDIDAAVERGLQANLTVRAQEFSIKEAEHNKAVVYGSFLPSVAFIRQQTYLSNDNDNTVVNSDYYNQEKAFQSIRVSQPLFSGFYGVHSISKAELYLQLQKVDLERAKERLAQNIRRQFIQYLKWADDMQRAQDSIERLEKQLAAAQAFFDNKMAPKLHVLQAEVAVAKARQRLDLIRTRQENSRMALNQLLGLDVEKQVLYSGSLDGMEYLIEKEVRAYLEEARDRPDIVAARLNVELSKKEELLVLSQELPKLTLDFSYNTNETDYDSGAYRDEDTRYWNAMLKFSQDIFRGGQTVASLAKQKVATKRFETILKELLSQMEVEVRSHFGLMENALQRISSARRIKEASLRSYERAEQRYKTGVGTSIEVFDAQNEVSRADNDITAAMADFQMEKNDLSFVTGKLLAVERNPDSLN